MRKLKLLFAAVALMLGVGTASAQTASAVGEGTFFLYNVGGAAYLTGANNWGTRASLDAHGLDCIVKLADGKYSIEAGNGLYLGKDGYVDKASNDGNYTTWSVTAVEGQENTYTLQASNNKYLVYDGTGTTCSMVDAAPTTNTGYWKFITKDALQNAADLANASETNPKDVTFFVDGANFVRLVDGWANNPGAKTDEKSGPWTYTISQNNFVLSGPQSSNQYNTGCEMYNNTFDIYQTVTVPNGFYYVTCDGFDASGNSRLYAGNEEVAFTGKDSKSRNFANVLNNIGEYSVAARTGIVTVKNGSLKIGVKRTVSGGWTVVDNIRLYCVGLYDAYSGYSKALSAAQAIQTSPMEGTVLAELQTAITTYGSLTESSNVDDLEAASEALATATATANSSIAAYASAKAYLDKMAAVLEGTNVYTQEAYNQYYGTWLAGYNAKTLETATAEGLNANVAYSTGWHSNNNIDDILLSTWTIGGEQAKDYDKSLYINTWSVEGNTDGSEFYTPFFEYWTGDTNSLDAKTLTSTVAGLLPNATYSFTMRVRVRNTNNQTIVPEKIMMQVGEGTAVDISAGKHFGTGQFYIGNFSAVGQTDADGKLVTTITVSEGSNVSWLSFYDCKYTEGEDLSAYIADYEFALTNVNKALTDDVAYAVMQTDLQAAATTYANVDNTDKAALIAAKEALETALAAYNAVVGPLKGNDISKWTTTGNNGSFQVNTWSVEGDTDGSNMKTPFTQNWINRGTNLTDATMSYTVEGLAPGYYKVSALIRSLNEAGGATPAGSFIFANDAIERAYNGTACTNGVYDNPVVYGLVGDDGKLTIGVKVIKANVNWVSWKNFIYTYEGAELTQSIANNLTEEVRQFEYNTVAQAQQAQAVQALGTLSDANYIAAGQAIEAAYRTYDRNILALAAAAQEKSTATLGFEAGEYAPYNVIGLVNQAQAVYNDPEAFTQDEIDALTADIANAQPNTEEVNAVYDGTFAAATNMGAPAGWTLTGASNTGDSNNTIGGYYRPRAFVLTSDDDNYNKLATFEQGDGTRSAFYFRFDDRTAKDAVYTYGATTGYTMPLKTDRIYKLTAKIGGWGHTKDIKMAIVNTDDENIVAQTLTLNKVDNSEEASDYEMYFVVPAAGDYKLQLTNSSSENNAGIISNILLKSTPALAIDGAAAMPTYAPGTYPKVTVSRPISAAYNTLVVPFAITDEEVADKFGEGAEVCVVSSYDKDKDNISLTVQDGIEANKPVILKATTAGTSYEFTNKTLEAAAAEPKTEGAGVQMVGTYAASIDVPIGNNNFIINGDYMYYVDSKVIIRNTRAYIQLTDEIEGAKSRLSFSIVGDEATGIDAVEGGNAADNGTIYNLSGQRVGKDYKGIVIKNGKKVMTR